MGGGTGVEGTGYFDCALRDEGGELSGVQGGDVVDGVGEVEVVSCEGWIEGVRLG